MTGEAASLSLDKFLLTQCPSFHKSSTYYPTPYLFNGHLQTGYASMYKEKSPDVNYERELLQLKDGGQLSLDWTKPLNGTQDPSQPIAVVLHGLTGGSHESYVHGVLEKLVQADYRAVVMNARGCADTEITTPQLFNGAWTEDLREALAHVQAKIAPGTPMVAIGFSLGSNILVKYLGEEKEDTPLHAAISVANPYDFLSCNTNLDDGFFSRHVYSRAMSGNLKGLYARHPLMKKHSDIDPAQVMAAKTIRQYDGACTCKVFGYTTVNNYFRDASSARFIEHVRIPLLCVNALDDPIATAKYIPWEEIQINPYVILATTDYGGHLGWFQNLSAERWINQPLAEFIMAMFKAKVTTTCE
ncbi:AB-hydrolase YheT [Hesseltinella vesiculosa]|uniref:AB-hydrolase YheT n=1 Tax=Hesseltinella vesiculosa TaxID=101127 RepID=A0A1X2G7W7_9FUNG|nr:AB-hydrolase YheT [Hesseltinella vesiculosa]